MPSRSLTDLPDQAGRLAVVTGATGGLGYETALALATAGSDVILAARNPAKGAEARARIRADFHAAKTRFELLDLADLASVAAFAERLTGEGRAVDVLINNAAVMALPTRQTTVDDFEMQFGVNYLGHFALTGRLLPLLRRAAAPRVVSLSSLAHRGGAIDFADLQGRAYRPWRAYQQSKLAMLIFAFELQRRSDANGWGLVSNAAHPGWSRTDLIANGPSAGGAPSWQERAAKVAAPWLSQSAAEGARPTLFAATSPDAAPTGYYGPDGFYELKGPPCAAFVARQAKDVGVAARLWEESQRLTSVAFPALAKSA
jgi:NAD(P)-dependent dehydrogenase (short-subunit alcohol dehydrogenase family)